IRRHLALHAAQGIGIAGHLHRSCSFTIEIRYAPGLPIATPGLRTKYSAPVARREVSGTLPGSVPVGSTTTGSVQINVAAMSSACAVDCSIDRVSAFTSRKK